MIASTHNDVILLRHHSTKVYKEHQQNSFGARAYFIKKRYQQKQDNPNIYDFAAHMSKVQLLSYYS